MRRVFFYIFILLFIAVGCDRPQLFKESRIVMDTVVEISSYGSDKDKISKAIESSFREIERIENLFNRFDSSSAISMINRMAGMQEVSVNSEIYDLIKRSIDYSRISGGAFDITVAPLVELWDKAKREKKLPDPEDIKETLKAVGYKNIVLNDERMSIIFVNKDAKIDLGGIVKGYAIDKVKDVLLSFGIDNALINVGGNIYALGSLNDNNKWKIGIRHPRDNKAILYKLELNDRAVSTSGDYERFFILNGRRFSHILNPLTGYPADCIISVTVITPSAEQADVLSTAVFVSGKDRGMELIKSIEKAEVFVFDKDSKFTKYP